MIVAHGNGTRASDASEAAAIRRVFGASPPPVTAFKWAFGHLIAASGTLDLILALRALHTGIVPGMANFRGMDPDSSVARLRRCPKTPQRHRARAVPRLCGNESRPARPCAMKPDMRICNLLSPPDAALNG